MRCILLSSVAWTEPAAGYNPRNQAPGLILKKDQVVNAAFLIAAVLAIGVFGVATWLAVQYATQPILGFHSFRQTQTALTAWSACRDGWSLAYGTPVAGYPWAIPFEFPIYQWIVAGIACPLGLALDPVGRLVSYLFWVLCLWPAWLVCRRLFAARAPLYFCTFTALFLAAPLYLFWGRSFLMETAALFFSLSYLACAIEMIAGEDRWRDAVMTFVFLTLALLQKSTTVLPLMLVGLVYLRSAWPLRLRSAMLWKGLLAFGLSFLIGVAWVKYSDAVKMHNAMGSMLTSSQTTLWNFGQLKMRYSEALWNGVIWERVASENIGGYVGVAAIALALLLCRGRRAIILVGLGLYLLYFMVFENLLFVHDYYPMSNTVYLVFALAVSVGALMERGGVGSALGAAMLVGVVVIELTGYFTGPRFEAERHVYNDDDPILSVAKFLREHTAPTDPILVYGDDWSSEIPYYGERRGFVVPRWFPGYLDTIRNPERYLDRGQSAIVLCGAARNDTRLVEQMASLYASWPRAHLDQCDVYLRAAPAN